jgi:hypothetical protein
MANMSPFIFLPLFMILNASLVVVIADLLSAKAEDSASSDRSKATQAETSFRKAA